MEVAIDALLLTKELIAGGDICRHRGRSWWEDQPQEEVVVEGGGCHKRIKDADKIRTSGASSSCRREHRELLHKIREFHRRRRRIEDANKFRAREP